MARRSRPNQRSAVLGTVKDKPSVAKRPSLTVPARGAPARPRSGRRNGRLRSNQGIELKEGDITGFRAGHDTSLPEARSRRRDDGSGQTAIRAVGIKPRSRRLVDLSSSNPIRWRPSRRPRTEARTRRNGHSQVERGIDKPRPVTEAGLDEPSRRLGEFDASGEFQQLVFATIRVLLCMGVVLQKNEIPPE
jgi:hypothetical protein